MVRYYANITGAANIITPFKPLTEYQNNSNHLTLEFNGDNLRTDSSRSNAALWLAQGGWFSFEMYGEGWEYLNLGSTTYIGRYNYWSTNGFEETFQIDINNGNVVLTKGEQTVTTAFTGTLSNSNLPFFPSTYGNNTRVNFYRLAIYGGDNKTLLYDFVPDYEGTTKGLRDKVSNVFYPATDQSKIELIQFNVFEADPETLSASYSGQSFTLTVNAEVDMTWAAVVIPSFITLSAPGGRGPGNITVTFAPNDGAARSGNLVFADTEANTATVVCTQAKHPLLVPFNNIYRNGLIN